MKKDLSSLLPSNATKLMRDLEYVSRAISNLPMGGRNVASADLAHAATLPWLGWAAALDAWSENWGDEVKRKFIKSSFAVHRTKGTIGAMRRAISAFGWADIKVTEWFEFGGEPYTFRVAVELLVGGQSFDNIREIYNTVMLYKNLRSHLESLDIKLTTHNPLPKMTANFGSREMIAVYPKERDV